jgi:predicted nucleotidyltransferase
MSLNKPHNNIDGALLGRIREALSDLYGDRLKGIVHYGSRVRDDFNEDSDIDLLVLLEGPVDFGVELRAIVAAMYDLQLEIDVPIEAFPADADTFETSSWPLYRKASEEGTRL